MKCLSLAAALNRFLTKMKRLIKSENPSKRLLTKEKKSAIMKIATCLSGVHYRRNEHDSKYI